MNHAEVSIVGMHQRAKDEITNVLNCTNIGSDDVFEVLGTDIMSISYFKRKKFYRIPCTACDAYLREGIPRYNQKMYELAYLSTTSIIGGTMEPFYRIVVLESKAPVSTCGNDSVEYYEQGVSLSQTGIYTIPTGIGRPVRFATVSIPDATQMSDGDVSSGIIMNYDGFDIYPRLRWHNGLRN